MYQNKKRYKVNFIEYYFFMLFFVIFEMFVVKKTQESD